LCIHRRICATYLLDSKHPPSTAIFGRSSDRTGELFASASGGERMIYNHAVSKDLLGVLLIATKFLGTMFTGVFGILGLVTDYREKTTNVITKWGRLALVGIVVSTMVAIASQAIETVLSRKEAREANAQLARQLELSNSTLAEVERSIFPLKDLAISYEVEIPIQNPLLAAYKRRLIAGIEQIRDTHGRAGAALGEVVAGSGGGNTVILLGPSLRPTKSDGIIYSLCEEHGIAVLLYRKPFDLEQFFQSENNKRARPDLSFSIEVRSPDLEYAYPSGALRFAARNMRVDPTRWSGNGRIAAIPDLSESQLLATVLTPDMGSGPLNGDLQSLLDGIHVLRTTIRIGDQNFELPSFVYRGAQSVSSLPKIDFAPSIN
jgi:hypothetical protein